MRVVMCGDFNARNTAWGDNKTTPRGRVLLEAMSALDMECVNGGVPTYSVPGRQDTVIDLCFTNDRALRYFIEWKILTEITLSDHRAIRVIFGGVRRDDKDKQIIRPETSISAILKFGESFSAIIAEKKIETPGELSSAVVGIVEEISRGRKQRKAVY